MPNRRTSCISEFQRGYTLLELVAVMLITGILATTLVLRTSSTSDRAVMTYADQLVRDLSHAQTLAMGWNVRLRLAVTAGGIGYSFQCRTVAAGICASVGSVPTDPASGNSLSRSFSDGVTILPSSGTNSIMDFDTLGRPDISSTLISSTPARSFTLSNSSKSVTVQVQPVTGLASAS